MPITSISRDDDALTMTVVADFPVPLQRLWDAYTDPRQLERFWGPPAFPATFLRHDAFPGGRTHYLMTGPDGEQHHGCWEWIDVQAPTGFEVLDGFADGDGTPNPQMPSMRLSFAFEQTEDGSRLTTTTCFPSAEALQELLGMGMEEGMKGAMAQMDAVLADLSTFAADLPTGSQILSDTQVRVSRVIRGSVDDVWRAHHDPDLLRRWLLGPDGWVMAVCEVASAPGEGYRYEWEREDGTDRFGFEGELVASEAPHRAVTTERMIGMPGEGSINELTLTAVEGGTLMSMLITYPSAEVRDMVLGTGMTTGMETSYVRLEETVLAPA